MQKGMFVKDIKALAQPGASVSGVFAVAASKRDLTKNGAPYWLLTLQDCSGSIGATIWSPLSAEFQQILVNTVALVAGATREYQGQTSIVTRKFEKLEADDWSEIADALSPQAPIDAQALYDQLLALCEQEFRHPHWSAFMAAVLRDSVIRAAFMAAPAAKSCHQAYKGGLLEHALKVAQICAALADLYPDLDRQALIAGAILHDIGKIREYSGALAIEITQAGALFGHSFLGLELLAPFLKSSDLAPALQEHLKHLIISHHGEHEFGAAVLPQTPEAFILHYADNIDAKMGICEAAFADEQAPYWSEKQWAVQRRLLLPERTPGNQAGDAADEIAGGQYSLLE